MNRKLAKGMNMWKVNGYATTLQFSQKGLEILYQERKGQVNILSDGRLQDHSFP